MTVTNTKKGESRQKQKLVIFKSGEKVNIIENSHFSNNVSNNFQ